MHCPSKEKKGSEDEEVVDKNGVDVEEFLEVDDRTGGGRKSVQEEEGKKVVTKRKRKVVTF